MSWRPPIQQHAGSADQRVRCREARQRRENGLHALDLDGHHDLAALRPLGAAASRRFRAIRGPDLAYLGIDAGRHGQPAACPLPRDAAGLGLARAQAGLGEDDGEADDGVEHGEEDQEHDAELDGIDPPLQAGLRRRAPMRAVPSAVRGGHDVLSRRSLASVAALGLDRGVEELRNRVLEALQVALVAAIGDRSWNRPRRRGTDRTTALPVEQRQRRVSDLGRRKRLLRIGHGVFQRGRLGGRGGGGFLVGLQRHGRSCAGRLLGDGRLCEPESGDGEAGLRQDVAEGGAVGHGVPSWMELDGRGVSAAATGAGSSRGAARNRLDLREGLSARGAAASLRIAAGAG
ncbi:unnamed protein product, partial [Brugia timori]|uniref:LigA n=1 Tax=Brugia timori TaxID=42155 RepID=A0A0R3QI70_9BILA